MPVTVTQQKTCRDEFRQKSISTGTEQFPKVNELKCFFPNKLKSLYLFFWLPWLNVYS